MLHTFKSPFFFRVNSNVLVVLAVIDLFELIRSRSLFVQVEYLQVSMTNRPGFASGAEDRSKVKSGAPSCTIIYPQFATEQKRTRMASHLTVI